MGYLIEKINFWGKIINLNYNFSSFCKTAVEKTHWLKAKNHHVKVNLWNSKKVTKLMAVAYTPQTVSDTA